MDENILLGNEPAGKALHLTRGERWITRWGSGESMDDEMVFCRFDVNKKITIYIAGTHLWIVDFRNDGKSDFWEYSNDRYFKMPGSPCFGEKRRHQLEPERIEKILNTKIPNNRYWDMVQKKAIELYNMDQ